MQDNVKRNSKSANTHLADSIYKLSNVICLSKFVLMKKFFSQIIYNSASILLLLFDYNVSRVNAFLNIVPFDFSDHNLTHKLPIKWNL